MTAYATQGDVYKYGLPRGALGNPGRLVESSLASTSTITLFEHGLETGDALTTRAADGGILSAPLVAGTIYYAIRLTDSTFQLAATPTGPAITLTTDGVEMFVAVDLPWDALLERYSRFVDGFVPAHAVPLAAPYPITVVAVVAELVAKKAQILSGVRSGSMDEAEASAAAQLKRWAAGVPVRDVAPTQQSTNLAVVHSVCDRRIGGLPFGLTDNGGLTE